MFHFIKQYLYWQMKLCGCFFFSKYHRTWLCICLRHQTGMILCWGGEDTVCFQADLSGGIPSLYKQYSKNALILFCNWVYKMYVHMYCKILGLLWNQLKCDERFVCFCSEVQQNSLILIKQPLMLINPCGKVLIFLNFPTVIILILIWYMNGFSKYNPTSRHCKMRF